MLRIVIKMPSITNQSKNEKTLTNDNLDADLTFDETTPITFDESQRPFSDLGKPITNQSKNEKSLTNTAENA